ncbi:MAG: PAS domain S-box protein [Flexistipes sinusarabici]|uniref:histidine kinase n=1 Tax=Flexistipes sinusarabici TaxID=2352 RepID=A0A5D0MQY6_FLESI|nr:ATP-binding protein [Flexistipes sinusarabici]TYB33878.1 MAG: PAS domain S-box protein [Flexistipes sinusarabici]
MKLKKLLYSLFLFLTLTAGYSTAFAAHDNILIINSYFTNYTWTEQQMNGFFSKLNESNMFADLEYYIEDLDTKKIPLGEEYREQFVQMIKFKYYKTPHSPKAIYITDDNAMTFFLEDLNELFPETPVIFSGVNNLELKNKLDPKRFSGCFQTMDISKNVDFILKHFGRNKQLIFIGDNSQTASIINKQIRNTMAEDYKSINYKIKTIPSVSDIKSILETVSEKNNIYILTTIGAVSHGISSASPISVVINEINAYIGKTPLISMEDVFVREGVLGGYVTSGKLAGRYAASILETLLQKPEKFKSYLNYPKETNEYLFNYQELQKYNIKIEELPGNAKIINKPFSVYEEYKEIIWLATLIVVFMFIAVVLLELKIIADRKFRETERKMREMLRISRHIIYHFSFRKQKYEYISEYASEILGFEMNFFYTPNPSMHNKFIYKDDYGEATAEIERAARNREKSVELSYRLKTVDGDYRWFRDMANLIYDENNNLSDIAGTAYDVDTEKRVNDAMNIIIAKTSRMQGLEYFNEIVKDIFQILQCKYVFIAKVKNENEAETVAFCKNGELTENFTFSIKNSPCGTNKDETKCIYPHNLRLSFPECEMTSSLGIESFFGFQMFDETGNKIGLLAAMDDKPMEKEQIYENILSLVSKRASLELERIEYINKLNDERERLHVIIKSIGDAVVVTDLNGTITLVNRTFENYYGKKFSCIYGKNIRDILFFYDENTSEKVENPVNEILENGLTVSKEVSALMETDLGERFFIEDSVSPLRDFESKIIGAVLIFRDATVKRKVEEEQAKQARLESVGILAGGIAHDFNNMLTALSANINLVKLLDKQNKFSEKISNIEQLIDNAKNLSQQLLTFSKGGDPDIIKVDIKPLVENNFEFMLRGSSVSYEINTDEELWTALIDPGQFSQVLQNLLVNARQAIEPDSGKVTAGITNYKVEETAKIYEPGRYLKLVLADNGPGIDKKQLDKIFDPYFSTKEGGSGLGLAITHSIIKKHNGHIQVDSEPSKGTTFTILIPATLQKSDEKHTDKIFTVSGMNKKILVMDDDRMIQDSLGNILTHYGFDVHIVSEGSEFLKKYKELMDKKEKPSLVFLDITIPGGMGAQEAIKQAMEMDSEIKAVVMSGYSESDAMLNPEKYGFVDVLKKPYQLNDLLFLLDKYT